MSNSPRRTGRIAGYGGSGRTPGRNAARRTAPSPHNGLTTAVTELFAWLATTAVAAALLSLLARHNGLLALPIVLMYALFCWLLWQFHQHSRAG